MRAPGLHLNHDKGVAIFGNNVDFAFRAPPVAMYNIPPRTPQVFLSVIFTYAPDVVTRDVSFCGHQHLPGKGGACMNVKGDRT